MAKRTTPNVDNSTDRVEKSDADKNNVGTQPGRHGGTLNAGGTPGNKGGGRPPNVFKNFLKDLRENPQALDALKRAALDETGKNFGNAWKLAAEYDEERPAPPKQELTGELTVRVVRD